MVIFCAISWAATAGATTARYKAPNPGGSMPKLGTVPFPNDLYFDGGAPAAGDGTLLNEDGSPIGVEPFGLDVIIGNQPQILLRGLNLLDGFGVTTPVWLFFKGDIDLGTLPGSKVPNNGRVRANPSVKDSVFLVEVGSDPPHLVPAKFHWDIDARIPRTLAVVPLEGEVLKGRTQYAAVVTKKLKAKNGDPVKRDADFAAALGAELATGAAYVTGSLGVSASKIVGMTVFTTQTTTTTLHDIRTGVVDACPTSVDFGDGLIFEDGDVDTFFGDGEANDVALVASGYVLSPRLQTLDPDDHSHRDGSGGVAELDADALTNEPDDERFVDLGDNGGGCDLTGAGGPDGLPDVIDVDPDTPGILDLARVPVSLSVPEGEAPANGWPVIIVQHGLGGDRQTTLFFAQGAAERGFAVIGIDSVDHGSRWDETDDIFNFTDEAGSDGLPDGDLGDAVSFGFFERFGNLLGIRDNFRQTYVDLMQLVRVLDADGFDAPVGIDLDPGNIYYLGLSLGGLMGAGMTPYVPEVRAVALDAPGGGLLAELFSNSVIGASSFALLQLIFGVGPSIAQGDFSFNSGLLQAALDPADGTTSAVHWVNDPFPAPFRPMNVILFEDMDDAVVPNQANEALAVAAGLELFDPHVVNLAATTRPLEVAATENFLDGNVDGTTTAGVFQVGPGAHAVLTEDIAELQFAPGHALWDELTDGDVDSVFVPLLRPVRFRHPGILDDVYDWFADAVANPGEPGRFEYTGPELSFNPHESQQLGKGDVGVRTFFARTVNAGGANPLDEAIADATIDIRRNTRKGRITLARSTLGTDPDGNAKDLPPGIAFESADVLPFFVSLQRPQAPLYEGRNLGVIYTDEELAASGCAEDDLFLARHNPLNSQYDALPSVVDAAANRVSLKPKAFQGGDGVYGVFCSTDLAPFNTRLGVESLALTTPKDKATRLETRGAVPLGDGEPAIDPTLTNIDVTVWEDRDAVVFSETLPSACWRVDKAGKQWTWKRDFCGEADPGVFRKATWRKQGDSVEFSVIAKGDWAEAADSRGGGGTQLAIEIGADAFHSSGGRCRRSGDTLSCSRYD